MLNLKGGLFDKDHEIDSKDEALLRSLEARVGEQSGGSEIDMSDPKANFDLGIKTLSESAKNPKMLAEALEMMKDPEIAAEVQKMMKDPAFQAEMKKFTESPAFKAAAHKTKSVMDSMESDPVKLKMMAAQMEEIMQT